MSRFKFSPFWTLLIGLFFISLPLLSQGIVIDHNCTDITKIPDSWITKVKSMLKIHYAHTSHGEQITVGLERLSNANAKYHFSRDTCNLPQYNGYLCLMDGQYYEGDCQDYITPDLYWESDYGLSMTRSVLNSFDVNISLWAWCTQLDYYNQAEAQAYLNAMAQLEAEYPGVTFIYMTGNAQSAKQNRVSRNNQIRNYCRNNNKILFDFGDLDCWYNGQQYTNGGIPMEHPHYYGDQAGHTTYQSCENKAKAFWWLLARIAGWDGGGGGTTPTPAIGLNKTSLAFNCGVNGTPPANQTFSISNTGTGTLNWTVSDNTAWLTCTPTSGTNSGTVTVSADQTGLTAGNYTAAITVSDPNASNSPQTLNVTLNVFGAGNDSPPFGSFDSPLDGATVQSSIAVTGWALDDIGIENIKIYRVSGGSLVYIGDAQQVDGARPDIETAYPGYPDNSKAGWGYMMLTNFLPNGGNGTYTLHAIATDLTGHQVTLGSKTITCDNANAVKPFGAIDTPTQGGTASGNNFINWGWVLTPQPNKIPIGGSTINVYVDGVKLGHPNYNIYRADIASLFPGFANSDGAAGYFALDTSGYDNDVHTIQWTASDNNGNTDGIGSRYFSVLNNSRHTENKTGIAERIPGSDDPPCSPVPITVKKGFNENAQPQVITPDKPGTFTIVSKELERIEISLTGEGGLAPLPGYNGYIVVGNQLRPLPIGSTLDKEKGIFYWLPGPGFLGNYELLFITTGPDGKNTKKKIIITIAANDN